MMSSTTATPSTTAEHGGKCEPHKPSSSTTSPSTWRKSSIPEAKEIPKNTEYKVSAQALRYLPYSTKYLPRISIWSCLCRTKSNRSLLLQGAGRRESLGELWRSGNSWRDSEHHGGKRSKQPGIKKP